MKAQKKASESQTSVVLQHVGGEDLVQNVVLLDVDEDLVADDLEVSVHREVVAQQLGQVDVARAQH